MQATSNATRKAHLLEVPSEVKRDGASSPADHAMLLGIGSDTFAGLLKGARVSDALAEEIEVLMCRPRGWMDTAMEPALA
jgi:hypothetical protein